MRQEQAFEFQKSLMHLKAEGYLTEDAATRVAHLFVDHLDQYCTKVVDVIKEKVIVWEAGMGEDDKTLYSLGLRRAMDVITETDPTESLDDE
jgi:hypothetical protein